ncbi:MAG: MFS transporter, partial [Halobacteriales archaeon]|nr:MFS transporter [Halobacteriales archaeon]
ASVGFALTLLWGFFAAVQYPGGRLSDELSRKTVIVAALFTASLGMVFFGLAAAYWMVVAGSILLGVGAGAYLVSMRTYLGELYSDRRGRAIGINQAVGNLGSTSAGFLAILVIGIGLWQSAFAFIAPLLIAGAVLVHVTSDEAYHVRRVSIEISETFVRLFRSEQVRYFVIAYAIVNFTFKGILSFLPTFLQVTKSFTSTEANLLYAAFFVAGIVVVPIAGSVSDRFARLRVILVSLLFGIIGLSMLVYLDDKAGIVVGVIVFAGGLSGFPAVMQSHLLGIFPPSKAGGDFGAFRTVYLVIGSLGPTYVGVLAERIGYTSSFAGFIAFLAICFLLILAIDRR